MDSPHDRWFQFTFRHAAHAAAWVKSVLPARLVEAIDWTTWRAASGSTFGPRLRRHFADAVFVAHFLGCPLRVVVVIEDKAAPDPGLESQLLRYCVHFRRALRERPDGTEPLVLPIVLHHGPAPFRHPGVPAIAAGQLDARVAEDLLALQPKVGFLVDDLTVRTEEQIRGAGLTVLGQLCLLSLRCCNGAATDAVLAAIDRWRDLLQAVATDDGPPAPDDALDAFECYVLEVTDVPDDLLRMALIHNLDVPPRRREGEFVTTAQRLRLEGRMQGKAEGRAEVLLRLLARRFGALPDEYTRRVQTATMPELDRWTDRILDATTLAAVFAE